MIQDNAIRGSICYDIRNMVEREHLIPDNFAEVTQRCLVQGLVVEVSNKQAHYVITHVLDGRDEILDDDFYPEYRSATIYGPWFSEVPGSYRALWEEARERYQCDVQNYTDEVELPDDLAVVPGDTIHVHETLFWEPNERGGKTGYSRYDVCKLPLPNIGVQESLKVLAHKRSQQIQDGLIEAKKTEDEEMAALERITSGQPVRPFNNPSVHNPNAKYYQSVDARFVYGENAVQDHFVEVRARTAYEGDVEMGGARRFGVDGSQYVVPSIMPFGKGSPDDPLYELRIHFLSETKLNPAVGEVRPVVLIDGVKYEALVDVEESSSSFKRPGHDVVFTGFRMEGKRFDMAKLTREQIDALDARSKRQRDISMRKLYAGVSRGEDFAASLDVVDEEAQQEINSQIKMRTEEQTIIDSIVENPCDHTISTGAAILVPRSMLDAIEIDVGSLNG